MTGQIVAHTTLSFEVNDDTHARASALAKQEFWIGQVNALFAHYAPGDRNA